MSVAWRSVTSDAAGAGRAAGAGVVLLAGLAVLAPLPTSLVERWYSNGLYPSLQRALTTTSNVVPVAMFDLWLVGALAWLVWVWRRPFRHTGRRSPAVVRALWQTLVGAAAAYLVFLLCWGLNYRREPLSARLDLTAAAPTTEAVLALGRDAVARANALHDDAHRAGWPGPDVNDARLRAAAAHVQALLGAQRATAARLKPTLLRWLFRWEGVDAMTNPFGLDVLRNPDLLPFERPFVAAHEWAHLAGFANEAEANFIGWLTCLHGDTRSQYSGWLFLYWQISAELSGPDRDALVRAIQPGVQADLDAVAARLRNGLVPALQQAGWAAYDQYLKANRVESGVRSYGEVLTLVLRARFDDRWRPRLRAGMAR